MAIRDYGRQRVETSNEDKVLIGEVGMTKGDLIDYYERIAGRLIPHLKERPLVLRRFPDGIDGVGVYQKKVGDHFPEWIRRVRVEVGSSDGSEELVVCDRKATLGYLANQACIALHPWLSRRDRLDHPDLLIVDLDPPGKDFEPVRRGALAVRDLFEELELATFVKLTGSRGVHIVVPLDRSEDFDAVRGFARSAMDLLAERNRTELTTEQRRKKRRGRLYLDVARNAYAQTAVAPWSVRPLPEAPVAAPIAWKDLERGRVGPRDYTIKSVFRRIARREDPWAGLRRHARSLRRARERLEGMGG